MAGHAVEAELAAGIALEYHRDMDLVLEIALDRLDHRHLVLEHDVHDVGPALGAEPDAIADLEIAAGDLQEGKLRLSLGAAAEH